MAKHILNMITLTSIGLLALAGCGGPQTPATQTASEPPSSTTLTEDTRAAELAAKEQELAQREADLQLKEREAQLVQREAELAAQQRATSAPPKRTPSTSSAAAPSRSTNTARSTAPAQPAATRVTVPAGTELSMLLTSDLSSKTAQSGDSFDARLASDLIVDGRVVAPAGSRVTGAITDVISGSSQIGGVPTLGMRFDQLELPDGQRVAINGELVERGKSDTGRDTAKILGGAAAGAVLGHQVKKSDSGKVIGGIVGGAIGAVAAKKTGTEVTLPADSTLTISLGAPIEITVK